MEGVLFVIDELGRALAQVRLENQQLREEVTRLASLLSQDEEK